MNKTTSDCDGCSVETPTPNPIDQRSSIMTTIDPHINLQSSALAVAAAVALLGKFGPDAGNAKVGKGMKTKEYTCTYESDEEMFALFLGLPIESFVGKMSGFLEKGGTPVPLFVAVRETIRVAAE